jgi:hypothetical protein
LAAVLRAADGGGRKAPARNRNPLSPAVAWAAVVPADLVVELPARAVRRPGAVRAEPPAVARPSEAVHLPVVLAALDPPPDSAVVAARGRLEAAAEVAASARRAVGPAVPRLVDANPPVAHALPRPRNPEAASLPAPRRAALAQAVAARAVGGKGARAKAAREKRQRAAVGSQAVGSPARGKPGARERVGAPVGVRVDESVPAPRAGHDAKPFTPCVVPQARLLSR